MLSALQAELQVLADYHQFHVQDGGINPPAPEDWSDEDVRNRGKVAANVVVVCPLRNMRVRVRVSLLGSCPETDLEKVDHAFRASVSIPTGNLQVLECMGTEALNWSVAPGTYQLLALFTGHETIDTTGLEGSDAYEVLLWPGPEVPFTVVKQWSQRE